MSDKHPDILDQASAITDFMTERAVAQRRAAAAPEQDERFDGKHCVEPDCGIEIPEPRLAVGRIRCVSCQELLEAKQRQFWKG